MKKLESLKGKLFEKEINLKSMKSITGGYTLTGCKPTTSTLGDESTCSDTDIDKPAQQSLSAL